MTDTLRVLVFGSMDDGPCDIYRFGMHREALAAHGVELRAWTNYRLGTTAGPDASAEEAISGADTVLDRSDLDWADVLVFRRFYVTRWSCRDCALVSEHQADLDRHARGTGHRVNQPERLVRPLFKALEEYPELLRGRAMVYETDDDLLRVQAWNGVSLRLAAEVEVVERMLRRADLVTVTTPVLASRFRGYNDAIRVVRNAVQPAWYTVEPGAPPVEGDPRMLYYAKPNRMRDYDVCRPAVDAVAARHPGSRRVWLGALNAPAGGPAEPVIAIMDEVGPFVEGASAFARSLATARPHIGLAPLVGDVFDQAKSELHWLEYSMAGAATVATRMPDGGPFDAIRDGVDGLLAETTQDWHTALERLVASRDLREEIAGRARERVLAEYSVAARAPEWADAYRWAAEHAGRAVDGRVHGLGGLPDAGAVHAEAAASLAHRRAARTVAARAADVLAGLRGGGATCWPPQDAQAPLVTVIVPVWDDPDALVRRAVESALAGTYRPLEVLLVAESGRLAAFEAIARAPGVRVVPATLPAARGDETADRWAATASLVAAGITAATGAWIAPLSPEVAFEPDHVATLLEVATEHGLELVYGQAIIHAGSQARVALGAWPPNPDGVLTFGTELFHRSLAGVVPIDPESWREAQAPGWAFWAGLLDAGARVAGIEHPVSWAALDDADAAPLVDQLRAPGATPSDGHAPSAPGLPGAARRHGRPGHQKPRKGRPGRR